MQKLLIGIMALAISVLAAQGAFAGEAEEAVLASCAGTTPTAVGYVYCVGAGFTGNEINKCINQPSQCYGPNNEVRKLFCSIGIGGCPKPPAPAELIRVFPFRGGCEAIYNTGIYFSPDCQNLRGGGQTINAWNVSQAHWNFVRGMVVFHDCIITAFNSGIYKSCDGINLGGGGNTRKVYEGAPVESMVVTKYNGRLVLRTKFHNNPYYCDPTGDHPGGGPGVTYC